MHPRAIILLLGLGALFLLAAACQPVAQPTATAVKPTATTATGPTATPSGPPTPTVVAGKAHTLPRRNASLTRRRCRPGPPRRAVG